jgi:SAM-dependent methyltransferase
MTYDNRYDAAHYYDAFSSPPGDDVSFYLKMLPGPDARVLELGCGTGRVMLPMIEKAGFVLGVDLSKAMLDICQHKLSEANILPAAARTIQADITTLDVTGEEDGFDFICAPFRVMQNLETDVQVNGLMQVIKRHLKPGGQAVLNTFKPRGGFDALAEFWASRDGSEAEWSKPFGDETVTMSNDCRIFAKDPVRVYPKLIYRRLNPAGEPIDEAVLDIVMRVWQADELIDLIERHGFRVTDRFGGYEGEAWAEGPELVVAFTHRD